MATGQAAWWIRAWLVDPRSRPRKPAAASGPDHDELRVLGVLEQGACRPVADDDRLYRDRGIPALVVGQLLLQHLLFGCIG